MTDTATAPRRVLDGRYELGAVIGQGTFGRVFRGYDRRLARPVAVKVIKPWWTEEPEWAERFEREAQLMARLGDPGIVQIHDIGYGEDGLLYYVAELVDGESLAERLSRGALPPREALDLAAQLCRALVPAHAQRVVHRDIKPANVLITRDGRVKVGDFGVARLADGTSEGPAGTVLGTPRYMAPEQARGQLPTPATDVYGVGVVLYEMLAGQPPFLGGSGVELALRHLEDPPPALPAHVPLALVEIVERALAKDPAERFSSAREMADALDAARSAARPDAPPVAAPPRAAPGPTGTRVAPRRSQRRNVNPPESRRYRALLLGAALVLAGLICGAILMAGGGTVRVPAVRGLDRASANARLRRADLVPTFIRHHSSEPVGSVITQRPGPGARVSGGSHVTLTLSAGPPPVSLPPLTGQQTAAAQVIVSRLGLSATINQVPAPDVTPGLVVQQIPGAGTPVAPHSRITLAVAETPRWRYLDSFGGHAGGDSGPFVIRGSRWRIVQSMGYDGTCTFIFFCSGPSATITNANTGSTVAQFDLSEGSDQTQVFSSGPGTYDIRVTPGSDTAHWSIQVQDDY